jgi:hypothetical protein
VLSIHFVDFLFQTNHHREHGISLNIKANITPWWWRQRYSSNPFTHRH